MKEVYHELMLLRSMRHGPQITLKSMWGPYTRPVCGKGVCVGGKGWEI